MNRNWRDYAALNGGDVGARAMFELDCKRLLKKMYPEKQVDTIRANPGDDGVDIYVGNIGQEPVIIYQCKFFLDAIEDAQKAQIRESFTTAIKATTYEMSGWFLIVPFHEFDMSQTLWFENWKQKQQALYVLNSGFIQIINGNNLIALMKEYEIYENVFGIKDSLNIKETHELVKDIHGKFFQSENEVSILKEGSITPQLVETIFSVNYTNDYEVYFVERDFDRSLADLLKYHKNIWVNGESGVGKTTSINRTLNVNKITYHYCYLTSIVSAQSVETIFEGIITDVAENYPLNSSNIQSNGNNMIKRLVRVLNAANLTDYAVIYIDEINISNEIIFARFVDYIIAFSQEYMIANNGKRKIKFILSTIQDPIHFCGNKPKVVERFQFLKISSWPESELSKLMRKIINALDLKINELDQKRILTASDGSPRVLKEILFRKVQNLDKSLEELISQYNKEIA